jgi:proteasome lid subunit RPN8/RPN11
MNWRFWQQRKTPPPCRPVVRVHETVLAATIRGLQSFGDASGLHEGIVYWAGREQPQEWIITTVILPQAVTTHGSFRTSAAANARVVALLAAADLVLLAQVHSHPGRIVDHSADDDADALMPYENFLSIIVPNYAKATMWPLDHCGVHRFEHGQFRRLQPQEVTSTIMRVPTTLGGAP